MKLYIHFGIYKTGSSYLQTLCALHRDQLKEKGVYFPASTEDHKMMRGEISKGNAGNLEYLIFHQLREQLEQKLEAWRKQAEEQKCDKVLISAEALVHQLAMKKSLELLIRASRSAGFTAIDTMGFFRDLVPHAISTYKHRAKSGKYADVHKWVKESYETPVLLGRLHRRLQEKHSIAFRLREYKKNSEWMAECFFSDWLNVDFVNETTQSQQVNTSLTLSEIACMQQLKEQYPQSAGIFLKALQAIPASEKARDLTRENHLKALFYSALNKHEKLLDNLSDFLNGAEKLHLYTGEITPIKPEQYHRLPLSLSSNQLNAFLKAIKKSRSLRSKLLRIKRIAGRISLQIDKRFFRKNRPNAIALEELYAKGTHSPIF